MSFASYSFIIFLLCLFPIYWLVKKREWQNLILLTASYFFYGWVTPTLAAMLGTSTLLDFFLARGMVVKSERRRLFMTLSLILNLGVLAFFKYYNFFGEDLAKLFSSLGVNGDFFLTRILFHRRPHCRERLVHSVRLARHSWFGFQRCPPLFHHQRRYLLKTLHCYNRLLYSCRSSDRSCFPHCFRYCSPPRHHEILYR